VQGSLTASLKLRLATVMLLLPPGVQRCVARCQQPDRLRLAAHWRQALTAGRQAGGQAGRHWRQALPKASSAPTSIMLWAASDTRSPAVRAITLLLITSCPAGKAGSGRRWQDIEKRAWIGVAGACCT
jgi:hypothetical protein